MGVSDSHDQTFHFQRWNRDIFLLCCDLTDFRIVLASELKIIPFLSWKFDTQLQQRPVVQAGLVKMLFYYDGKKTNKRNQTFLSRYRFVCLQGAVRGSADRCVEKKKNSKKNRSARMRSLHTSSRPSEEHTQNVCHDGEVKSPSAEHQSLCSIFTLGGFRKDLFFFSLLFFPWAWKDLQLSTRPSRDSFTWDRKHTRLRSCKHQRLSISIVYKQVK